MASRPLPDVNRAVDAFMARVLGDPAAQARLASAVTAEAFAAVAVALASDFGIVLAASDIVDRLRADPLDIARFYGAPVTLDRWPGLGWLPARSVPDGNAPAFDWAWVGDASPVQTEYNDAMHVASMLPFNRMFRTRTSLEALVADSNNHATTTPSGFIFHMSRCGSTLAARMLAALPGHVVVVEPEPLDAVVQWITLSGVAHDKQVAALRAMVAALGRPRVPGQRRFFLKLDVSHTLALPLFRAAYPDVPWLYLYREPLEVLVSQAADTWPSFLPGMLPPMLIGEDFSAATSPLDYAARVLARYCGAVVEHWPLGGGMLAEYRDLVPAMERAIPAHFGFVPDARELAEMATVAATNAKYPSKKFVPDAADKRDRATPEIRAAAAAHLAPCIDELDKLRRVDIPSVDDS